MYTNIFYDFYDADEYKNFIKHVLKQFRTSQEYSIWLNSFNRNECGATGLTKDGDGVQIEVHHFQITLWGWVEYILDKFHQQQLPVNTFYVSLILCDIHFNRCVPCVPLTHCIHKMLHENYDDTIARYPSILENIWPGDINRADQIIEYHLNLLKERLNIEEELLKNEEH
jgi:hypothetical protein